MNTRVPVFECPSAPPGRTIRGLAFSDTTAAPLPFRQNPALTAAVGDYVCTDSYAPDRPPVVFGNDYSGVEYGMQTSWYRDPKAPAGTRPADISDGLSNTSLVTEQAGWPTHYRRGQAVTPSATLLDTFSGFTLYAGYNAPWAGWRTGLLYSWAADGTATNGPCAINCTNEQGVYSFHTGGANVLMGDGAVRFVRESLTPDQLAALVSRAGDDPAPAE